MLQFLRVAEDLEVAGLVWLPEIGDEISSRDEPKSISVLVDPQGMPVEQLRSSYLWLPTVEQMVSQFEARQAVLFHAGLELTEQKFCYKTIVQTLAGHIESTADSLRTSVGLALRDLLLADSSKHLVN